jgi:hypothetical protein
LQEFALFPARMQRTRGQFGGEGVSGRRQCGVSWGLAVCAIIRW